MRKNASCTVEARVDDTAGRPSIRRGGGDGNVSLAKPDRPIVRELEVHVDGEVSRYQSQKHTVLG